jgi:hypothetical protein
MFYDFLDYEPLYNFKSFDEFDSYNQKLFVYIFMHEIAKDDESNDDTFDKQYNPSSLIIRKSKNCITDTKQDEEVNKTDDILENDNQLELFKDSDIRKKM